MLAELLSGSAPPVEFFSPFALLVLAALYGSGAILVRELRVRWRKGWPTVFVLGAAYGIVEEGLMVKSFFDPNWMDLGPLGSYGRWAGVNWVWSLQLTIFHAVFSIAIPILLVELIFPAQRGEHWIGRRGMIGLSLLLLADVLLGFFALTTYRPPFAPYVLAIVAVVALFLIARQVGDRKGSPLQSGDRKGSPLQSGDRKESPLQSGDRKESPLQSGDRKGSPLRFALLGFGATLVFFVIQWAPPKIGVPVPLTLLATVALVVLVVWMVQRMSRGGAWPDQHRLALAGGALMLFVLLAPVQELDNLNRPDDTTGMTLVGLATLVFLVWLWRRVARRDRAHLTQ
ncbi:MAG: hypothetical protein DRI77_08345 [Chloroflexi bacterium]|nr:MAG: hypothetical protein DRI77_08345 [Chloroflexota bacterium]